MDVKNIKKQPVMLSDKISSILNTAPGVIDPEDDVYEATAKLVENDAEVADLDEDAAPSKFRKQNLELLGDVDVRYAGKKLSRQALNSDDEESSVEDEADISTDEDESTDDSADTDDEIVEDPASEKEDSETEVPFSHLKTSINQSSQMQKGASVKNQLLIWENLLETRIKLQKCLIVANKLPQSDAVFKSIKEASGEEFHTKVSNAQNNLKHVLDSLITLQSLLLKSYPETQNLKKIEGSVSEENDEVPSDTDEEEVDLKSDVEEELDSGPPKKKQKLEEYESTLSTQHQDYKQYRNSVIKKWNDKTRIAVAKHTSLTNNSIVQQIEFILNDRSKLIKRTQLKRSNFAIVGDKESEREEIKSNTDEKSASGQYDVYNTEIYDDDDFYHQLLRELIEFKSADVTDPVKLSRQWIALQSMRSKMKRKVDTKATKGRRIRYAVHSKLVNFMAPVIDNRNSWRTEAQNEFFSSLFGNNSSNVINKKKS